MVRGRRKTKTATKKSRISPEEENHDGRVSKREFQGKLSHNPTSSSAQITCYFSPTVPKTVSNSQSSPSLPVVINRTSPRRHASTMSVLQQDNRVLNSRNEGEDQLLDTLCSTADKLQSTQSVTENKLQSTQSPTENKLLSTPSPTENKLLSTPSPTENKLQSSTQSPTENKLQSTPSGGKPPGTPSPHKIELLPPPSSPSLPPPSLSSSSALHSIPLQCQKKNNKTRKKCPSQPMKTLGSPLSNRSVNNNHKLTEYFPVRRSVRKTKKTVLEEKQRCLEEAVLAKQEDGLEVHMFEGKGRGVVAVRPFYRGQFVVEYVGELITSEEAREREQIYSQDQNTGCYMYYFKHHNIQYCVDATAESDRLGRLVNHSRNGNLTTKTVVIDNVPHLVLIAKEDIQPGEEITYDYGDRSKESLRYHPWLAT